MKAVLLARHGDASGLVLDEVPTPAPGPREVRVRVEATGVNHMDLLVRRGYPGIPVKLPHVLGGDVVGVVAEVGRDARRFAPGDRVIAAPASGCGECDVCREGRRFLCGAWSYLGFHRPGGYAEHALVPEDDLVLVSRRLDATLLAALPVAGLTAFHALHGAAALRAGQTLFVWGGAGALGSMAIAIARAAGARVVTTASSDARRALATSLGAELALDPRDPELVARVRRVAPAGADVVLDAIGADTFARSFELVRKGGTLVVCGMIGGREAPLSIHQTYLRHVSVRGVYLGSHAELRALVELVEAGRVAPHVGAVLPLERAADAQALVERRENLGKVALRVGA